MTNRVSNREAMTAMSRRRQPADELAQPSASREATTAERPVGPRSLPPLRGSTSRSGRSPWADAHGYSLPSLRDFGRAGCSERPVARRGFTLIELIATCILLGVVFSVSIPLLTVVAQERRSAEQRQFALQHAANLLERATTKSWSELPVGDQSLTDAPADVQTLLPGLERQVEVKELSETPRSKQVTVSIRWKSRSGQLVAPVRLSAWVYPNGEGQP